MINTYHPITIHYIYTPSPLCHRHPNPIACLSMVLKKTRGIPECTLPPTSSNRWLTPPLLPPHHIPDITTHILYSGLPRLGPSETYPQLKDQRWKTHCIYSHAFISSQPPSLHHHTHPSLRPSRIGAKWWEHSTKRQVPLEMQISWTTIWAIGLIGVPITTTTRRTRTPPMNKLCSTYTPIIGRATFLIG